MSGKATDGGVLDVRRLTLTRPDAKRRRLGRVPPCTLMVKCAHILGECFQIEWEDIHGQPDVLYSSDHFYRLSLSDPLSLSLDAEEAGWLCGGPGTFQAVPEAAAKTEAEREALKNRLTEKSRDFLASFKEAGLTVWDFSLADAQWIAVWDNPMGTGDGSPNRYGLSLSYLAALDHVPVTRPVIAYLGSVPELVQHIQLIYRDDGSLLEMEITGRETDLTEETAPPAEASHLLPFSEAAERFEEYSRTYYDSHEMPMKARAVSIHVTQAVIEYRHVRTSEETGYLRPVWNFYGTISADTPVFAGLPIAGGSEVLLASVDAYSGDVYGD